MILQQVPGNEGIQVAVPDTLEELIEINSDTVLHRSLLETPLRVTGSKGLYLHLEDGRKFLDATGGAAVACLGHNHPTIKEAMINQIEKVSYVPTIFYSTSPAEELCSLLIKGTNGAMSRAYLCNSGSEAVEAAMKMARQYYVELEGPETKRHRFISRWQSYHGTTLAGLSLGGHVMRRKIYEPMLTQTGSRVSPCYAYRGKEVDEDDEHYVARLAAELEAEILRLGSDTVCGFVAEPVVGAALGSVPSVPGYWKEIRKVCDKYGVLLIADEVMSGMGRSGYLHAWQAPDIDTPPDLQTIGKGLGGGYQPIAALLLSPRVVNTLTKGTGVFSHGHTYQAHAVGAAAAAAVQKIIMQPSCMENVRKCGAQLEKSLKDRLSDEWYVGDIRGKGLFWSVEFVQNKQTKQPFDAALQVANNIHKLGMEEPHMISLYPGTGSVKGTSGDFVMVAPMYNCTSEEIELIAEKAAGTIKAWFKSRPDLKEV